MTDANSAVGLGNVRDTGVDEKSFVPQKLEIKGYTDFTYDETRQRTSCTVRPGDVMDQ